MALSAAITNPKEKRPILRHLPVAANAVGFVGGIAVMDAGFLKPGSTDTGLVAVGRLEEDYDNTGGANGAISATVRKGCFPFNNSAGADEIDLTDIGATAYIVDDETVALTDDTGARSAAGEIFDVNEYGVWVLLG